METKILDEDKRIALIRFEGDVSSTLIPDFLAEVDRLIKKNIINLTSQLQASSNLKQ